MSASEIQSLLKMSVFPQITLAAETHLAEGLTLKWQCALNIEQSLINLVGIHRQTESRNDE